jgi:hypothetical protein
MVRPFVLQHSVIEFLIVVRPRTDVKYKIVISMILVEVVGYIVNGVPECFFKEIGSRICHGNYPIGDIG